MFRHLRSPRVSSGDALLSAILTGGDVETPAGESPQALIASLTSESLAGYVHHALGELPAPHSQEIAALRDALRPLRMTQAVRTLHRNARLEDALNALQGIPLMPLKGTELVHRAYASPELRESCDIDLWVQPDHLEGALAALAKIGFHETDLDAAIRAFHRGPGHHVPLECKDTGVLLELHHKLYPDLPEVAHREIWNRGNALGS